MPVGEEELEEVEEVVLSRSRLGNLLTQVEIVRAFAEPSEPWAA